MFRKVIEMPLELSELVNLSIGALRDEDVFMRSCVMTNPSYGASEKRGIMMMDYERHFQYLIARKLIAHTQYRIDLEVDYHDLVIRADSGLSATVVEMKRWMSTQGTTELPKMREDLAKLRGSKIPGQKVFMTFSANPAGITQSNSDDLIRQLGLLDKPRAMKSFSTYNSKQDPIDFWVLGIQVN